jgi:hypothetical protein
MIARGWQGSEAQHGFPQISVFLAYLFPFRYSEKDPRRQAQRREGFFDAEKGMRADRSRIRENSECSEIIRILTNSATKILHGVAASGEEFGGGAHG